jgi:hypothetical protein
VQNDLANLQAGIYTIKNANHRENILICYTPLGINDWGIISFIPEKLIAIDSHEYVFSTFLISIIAITLFAIITITAFLSYKKNKKEMEHIAFIYAVTQGLNNEGFQLRFKEIVVKARPNTYSIVLINMKNFKLINQQYGKKQETKPFSAWTKPLRSPLKQ